MHDKHPVLRTPNEVAHIPNGGKKCDREEVVSIFCDGSMSICENIFRVCEKIFQNITINRKVGHINIPVRCGRSARMYDAFEWLDPPISSENLVKCVVSAFWTLEPLLCGSRHERVVLPSLRPCDV